MQGDKFNLESRTESAGRRPHKSCRALRANQSTVVRLPGYAGARKEYLETYFECINRLLKPKGGIAVFQCITMPENRYEAYSKGEDFIRKYIFPGGHLVPDAILNIGGHYAKTLRLWRQRFERNFNNRIRPALLEEHESMTEKDIELFRRKWQVCKIRHEKSFNWC